MFTEEMTITVSGPAYAFLVASLAPIIAGKMLQQGGVSYARGGRWMLETLLGTLISITPFFVVLITFIRGLGQP